MSNAKTRQINPFKPLLEATGLKNTAELAIWLNLTPSVVYRAYAGYAPLVPPSLLKALSAKNLDAEKFAVDYASYRNAIIAGLEKVTAMYKAEQAEGGAK